MRKSLLCQNILIGLALIVPAQLVAQTGMGGTGGMDGSRGGLGHGGMGGGMAGGDPGDMEGGSARGPMRRPDVKPLRRDRLDKPVAAMFQQADVDRDGLVTLDELRGVLTARRDAIIRARFDRIDTSRNKLIEPAEFIAWQAALGSAAASDRQAMGQDNGPISESLSPTLGDDQEDRLLRRVIEPLSATLITNANSNYDRGLSLDELLAYERQKFDALDSNKDGFIVIEELHLQKPGDGNGPRDGMRGPGMGQPGGPPPPCGADGNC
jgi:hypothetical protein